MENKYFEYALLAPFILTLLIASFAWQNTLDFTINVCSAYVGLVAMWFGDVEFPKDKVKAIATNLAVFGFYSLIVIFSTNIALEDIF